ncbi:NAD synthetase / Glutamine amidotransferase chain of NAD synthetase [Pseudonocardia sp. Ae168_Ps1]|uniref:NAD(+) synthase n=1 Tax=unclassified Pseudonocardia TaxID=2619320 RepID=UPI00094AF16C|nr:MULTISPECIES: NAD(+) synthase [unclassified Pseudonocardia]OLL73848.1 NAD synthetase / Glutamine amidotransferase chain of NAD synthetase [Pseudonocardia sp. Ae150A_Ps1]OLL79828.1 NAD synthetase / Glutamine amidotransferase chain of NAD synthetase [Pseudonocardia sp. Ae168_Ps1]OLL86039.1 NAD synthetase / Glutamine amidotransferase chain of NAD synthetase [Pseudonocardia sp. Ae263_Ps1]OLL93931.1 NAD synthetase / Glutamine amidotransferase chain of NAD synthetase [Pseudonocardia sp. Ae356_Ps1]
MDFRSVYRHRFLRAAAATLHTTMAEPAANAAAVLDAARSCHDDGVGLVVFPELTLSGYSIEDVLLQDTLLEAVERELVTLAAATAELLPVLVVGAPLRHRHRVYNTAVVIHRGRILGVAPKSYLPTYREFYERRQLAAGDDVRDATITVGGTAYPFGTDLLFRAEDLPGFVLHAEICEDFWVPVPPSAEAALAGATVLANLSGSPITVGRAEQRRLLCRSASSRCLAGYVYAAAGEGESTTDVSWDGQTLVYENGELLAESERFPDGPRRAVADLDLDLIAAERRRQGTFDDNRRTHADRTDAFRTVTFRVDPPGHDIGLRRTVERFPFVPADAERLEQDCYEAYSIQVSGLEQRLRAIGQPKVVIGVSGGLDSTHALIVAARAMDRLGRPRSDILAFTMPGFATSDHTRGNAVALSEALGVTFETLDITGTARTMLTEIGHPFGRGEPVYDVTFENVQAGLRTDYLFRLANQRGGIVLGTGDLSELALGWSTYGVGDQMSHYNVNGGVPKTLMQHLIRWVISSRQFDDGVSAVLRSVLDTEITPELVPSDGTQEVQSSQATVGPYALQDFTLWYTLRYGFRPSKIAFLAGHAWSDPAAGEWPPGFPDDERPAYDAAEIRCWLQVFAKRFFAFAQFKRSALPNGPKVSAGGALSPRGDWRAPSDMSAALWLAEIEREVPDA